MNLFFWFFLVGFLIAALQDLKRREVDNWLNLFLFFSGFIYVLFNVFYYDEISFLVNFGFLVFIMFSLAYLFYFSKVFAGGDCKLLFASTPLLVSFDFISSVQNVLFFCVAILFVGAVYGIFWIVGLFLKDFNKNKKDFILTLRKSYLYLIPVFVFFVLGFIDSSFFFLFGLSLFLIIVFLASRSVEKNSLVKLVHSADLREGDWLEKDLKIGSKTIKATFDGLSLEDVSFLRKFSKYIKIKDGVPYAPVFFFSWILFYFRGLFMEFLVSILGV